MQINRGKLDQYKTLALHQLSRWITICLRFSSVCMALSIVLRLIYFDSIGLPESIAGYVIWYAIIIAFYSVLFSVIGISVLALYYRKRQPLWPLLQKKIILLFFTIALILLFALLGYYLYEIRSGR